MEIKSNNGLNYNKTKKNTLFILNIQIYREKRNKIWEEAKAKRIALEKWIRANPGVNNTKFKKRRRKIV